MGDSSQDIPQTNSSVKWSDSSREMQEIRVSVTNDDVETDQQPNSHVIYRVHDTPPVYMWPIYGIQVSRCPMLSFLFSWQSFSACCIYPEGMWATEMLGHPAHTLTYHSARCTRCVSTECYYIADSTVTARSRGRIFCSPEFNFVYWLLLGVRSTPTPTPPCYRSGT